MFCYRVVGCVTLCECVCVCVCVCNCVCVCVSVSYYVKERERQRERGGEEEHSCSQVTLMHSSKDSVCSWDCVCVRARVCLRVHVYELVTVSRGLMHVSVSAPKVSICLYPWCNVYK